MSLIDIQYLPGTQKSPQQTKITQPCFTDTDHVHFPDGRFSTLPPYSSVTNSIASVTMSGKCRSEHAIKMTGTYEGSYYLFGTSYGMYALKNNQLYNMTPLETTSVTLGANPIATRYDDVQTTPLLFTSGSNVIQVFSFLYDEVRPGDVVTISGIVGTAGFINGIPITEVNATHTVLTVVGLYFTIRVDTSATSSGSPTEAGSVIAMKAVKVTYAAHGLAAGDRIKITDAAGPIGGIPAAEINKEHEVSVVETVNTFVIKTATAPTSFASGGGAGVDVFKQIAAGNSDQSAAVGYGVGIYGEGLYGQGGPSVAAQSFPRIWSFGTFGNEVVMCPGDYLTGDGQKIYIWDGNTEIAPTVLTNAPTDCNWVGVVNNSVVALCGRTVKISEIGDATVWSGLTYYEKTLERVWKLVSLYIFDQKSAVIYTPQEAILLRYVGGGDIWDLSDLFTDDGILAPMMASSLNGVLEWQGARGKYSYDGGIPKKLKNVQNEEWQLQNLNFGKAWKCFCSPDQQNEQMYYYFPTGTDSEPGDYQIRNGDTYTLGRMTRTSGQRPGFLDSAFFMVDADNVIYRHFTTGAVTFDWYAVSSEAYAFGGESRAMVDMVYPDSNQSGTINFTLYGREFPQGELFDYGATAVAQGTTHFTPKAAGKILGWRLDGDAAATTGAWKMNIKELGRRAGNAV